MASRNLQVMVVPVTPFQQNCALVWCTKTMKGAIVDPGGDVPLIEEAMRKAGILVEKIILTHGHIDHAGGARELADRLKCRIEGPHQADQFLLDELALLGLQFGMPEVKAVTPDRTLAEGAHVAVGEIDFEARHIPGHTPGHVVLVSKENRFALVGDTLFRGSIGRTDFPYGDHAALIRGIEEKLLTLSDDTALLPGHGNMTTIGEEKRTNPFLLEARRA